MFLRFQRLFAYESQANAKVIASFNSVPGSNRTRPEFKRAIDIFGHLQAARRIWLGRLGGNVAMSNELHPQFASIDDAADEAEAVDVAWKDYTDHLTDAKLRQTVDYTSTEGKRYRTKVEDILGHALMHSAYHRGQIAMLVKQSGGEPAQTDYIFSAREAI